MKLKQLIFLCWLPALMMLISSEALLAQPEWPMTLKAKNGGELTIYQPQPISYKNNVIEARAAISVMEKPGADLIFGAIWVAATTSTDRESRMLKLESVSVKRIKLPDLTDSVKVSKMAAFIESEVKNHELTISLDQLLATIEENNPKQAGDLKNTPPKIYYKKQNSLLVLTDGTPKLEKDDNIKMERVMNSPFLIVKYPGDNKFYLNGGNFWYEANEITGSWTHAKKLPKEIQDIDKMIKEKQKKEGTAAADTSAKGKTPATIVLSTEPAELIQTTGEPVMKPIAQTGLLYVDNTDDNIFLEIESQKYFVLLAGRWYQSASLDGPWEYVASDKLPADFAKIPEGTDKDEVLSSVPGTDAANEAVMDAQIPQTAKVDRATATCTVKYDGEPVFEKIEGTSLSVAKNTSSTVLQSGSKYFCVENGIWFQAAKATGPWTVSDERPSDVDKIPASSPAYNVQYVYVYESTPQYVYVGYTPGYMGCYVYGPTVVYGTGYYYSPWYGPYYYPRPVTYGFSMHYNPYFGWSMGFGYSTGCMTFSMHFGGHGGYWGPHGHYPPYHHPYHGGYYGHRSVHHTTVNINHNTNIYNNHRGVTTNNINRGNRPSTHPARGQTSRPSTQPARGESGRPSTQPAGGQTGRPAQSNNVFTDRDGNVYQKGKDGNVQQRNNNQWQNTSPSSRPSTNDMNRPQQQRDRGQTRDNNFNQSRPTNSGAGRPSGGGSRPSGGGASKGGGGRR